MRTIDADKMREEWLDYGENEYVYDTNAVLESIDNQPTIDQYGTWIPVTERLPEDWKRVLVWFEYYRYGEYNRLYQSYGIGFTQDKEWSRFINGTSGWRDLRILAWMPLPLPYRKEKKDGDGVCTPPEI